MTITALLKKIYWKNVALFIVFIILLMAIILTLYKLVIAPFITHDLSGLTWLGLSITCFQLSGVFELKDYFFGKEERWRPKRK